MRENSIFRMFAGTLPQMMAVFCGTISAVSDGMQYGWSAPFIPVLEEPDSPVKISSSDTVWLEQIYMMGSVCGLAVTIYMVDRVGRKKSILLAAVFSLIAWVLIAIADHVAYLYVARFTTGLCGDVAFVAAPMYVAEIADQKIRGFLSGIIYLMMLVGILVVYGIGPYVPIYATSIVGGSFLVFQLITFPFMPDSPYYLLMKKKRDEAKKNLLRLRNGKNIDKELDEMEVAVNRQQSERGRPQDLLLVKGNRKAIIIMTVLNGAQHFSCISVILMNLHTILEAAGSIYLDSNTAAIIFAGAMLVSATIADFIIDKFGRKFLLTTSCLFTGLSLLVIAIYFTLKKNGFDVSSFSWIPIASVMFYAAVFKFGLGMVPIVMTAELFSSKVKAMGMTISDAVYVIMAMASIEVYQRLADSYGIDIPFYVFFACTMFTAAFCAFYIPETRGKSLEEIQFILKGEPYPHNSPANTDQQKKSSQTVENGNGSESVELEEGKVNETFSIHL